MTTTNTDTSDRSDLPTGQPYVLGRDQGVHYDFLNVAATIKATAGAEGSMSAVEFDQPRGFGPPLHCHAHEDEIFVLLDGAITVMLGDQEVVAEPGAFVFLPRGVPHTFQVTSETARMVSITASSKGAPTFDRMVAELGTPTDKPVIPEPGPIDPGHVAMVNAAHGIEILGPPPGQ